MKRLYRFSADSASFPDPPDNERNQVKIQIQRTEEKVASRKQKMVVEMTGVEPATS